MIEMNFSGFLSRVAVGFFILQSSFSTSIVLGEELMPSEGGGGRAGNGFPKKFPVFKPEAQLPAQADFDAVLQKLGAIVPTFAMAAQALNSQVKGGAKDPRWDSISSFYSLSSLSPQLLSTTQTSAEDYVSYQLKVRSESDIFPTELTLFFWGDFFQLPKLADNAASPSQVKGLLHEFVHVLITRKDELNTVRLADLLMGLAQGKPISDLDAGYLKSQMSRLETRVEGARSPNHLAYTFTLTTYLAGSELKAECGEFQISRQEIGDFEHDTSNVSEALKEKRRYDPFFDRYVRGCLRKVFDSNTKRAPKLVGERGQFQMLYLSDYPDLFGQFVKNVAHTEFEFVLSPKGWTATYLEPLKAFIGGRKQIKRSEIADAIKGYEHLELLDQVYSNGRNPELYLENISNVHTRFARKVIEYTTPETTRMKLKRGLNDIQGMKVRLEEANEASCWHSSAVLQGVSVTRSILYFPMECAFVGIDSVDSGQEKKSRKKRSRKSVSITFDVGHSVGAEQWTGNSNSGLLGTVEILP